MKPSLSWLWLFVFCVSACTPEEGGEPKKHPTMEPKPVTPPVQDGKVVLSDEEWKARLDPEAYRVLRLAGTEPAFGEAYKRFKAQGEGSYHCAGCDALLFTSKQKFDSHCGWPSFYDPADAQNVITRTDVTAGMVRTEVLCARCGGHLGHVFEGEGFDTPTDKRYCINGVTLKFVEGK
ncbi:MAG TPA: peptide-methionine (R)-S-oxide reductase MsrB [Luteolibacter sp.]|nr:peptide-methionine (R)-S-oxide reductase MsrB [Luteolibacter sp.]